MRVCHFRNVCFDADGRILYHIDPDLLEVPSTFFPHGFPPGEDMFHLSAMIGLQPSIIVINDTLTNEDQLSMLADSDFVGLGLCKLQLELWSHNTRQHLATFHSGANV